METLRNMKKMYIEEPVYGGNLNIFYGCKKEKFDKHMLKKLSVDTSGASPSVKGVTYSLIVDNDPSRLIYVIWLESLESIPCLVHELFHHTQQVLEKKGLFLNGGTTEVYAYYQEFFLRTVIERYEKKRNKKAR